MENELTIRILYPNLTEVELQQADDNLEQYLLLVLRVYERLTSDPERYAHLRALTASSGTVSSSTSPRPSPPGNPGPSIQP
jgi:hypothetical protein